MKTPTASASSQLLLRKSLFLIVKSESLLTVQVCLRVQGHCVDVQIHLGFMKQNLLNYGGTYKCFSPRTSTSLKLNCKIDQCVVYDCVSIANAQLSLIFFFSLLFFYKAQ